MKSIELNLASRPYRNDSLVALLLGLMCVAALGFTAHNTYAYLTADAREQSLLGELSDHRARMEEVRAEAQSLKDALDDIDVQTLESQASFVAAVMRERNFSWTRLFNELEAVVPWNIRLSSIRPGFSAGRVRIDLLGTAQNVGAFFDFQEIVEGAPAFSGVLPTQYEIDEKTGLVTFSLQASYVPDARIQGNERADAPDGSAGDSPAGDAVPVLVVDETAPAAAPARESGTAERDRGKARRSGAGAAAQEPSLGAVADDEASRPASPPGSRAASSGRTARPGAEPGAPQPGQPAGRTVGRPAATPAGSQSAAADAGAASAEPAAARAETADRPQLDPNEPLRPTQVEFDDQGRLKKIVPRINPDRAKQPLPPNYPKLPPGAGEGSEGDTGGDADGGTEGGGTEGGGTESGGSEGGGGAA